MKYKIVLKMAGIEYKTSDETIYDALLALPLKWNNIKAKATITVSQSKKSYEHLLYLKPLRRCFANKTAMLILSKRLKLLLSSQ